MTEEKIGKVVEVKKLVQVEYSAYYYAPFSGGGSVEAEPGIKFKITGVRNDGVYICYSLDKKFVRKVEKIEMETSSPILQAQFGHIDGFYLPATVFESGAVEIVDWEELEVDEEDYEDDEDVDSESFWNEDESDECESEQIYGYPEGYAQGDAQGTYCVIDLAASEGTNPVSYLHEVPDGGWTDEYKTTKIVLKLVKGGEFTMGNGEKPDICEVNPPHKVRLPNDFYIGIFPVTKRQYELVTGQAVAEEGLDDISAVCPMTSISYNDIRGTVGGFNWPKGDDVDFRSFLSCLRARSGIGNINIPTAAQWEYACKAGNDTSRALNDEEIVQNAWIEENAEGKSHPVGLHTPNAWGLYDMLGNVWEWCLDWYGGYEDCEECESPAGVMPDFSASRSMFPFMSPAGQNAREIRGGGWNVSASDCDAGTRGFSGPSQAYDFVGFRLSITLNACSHQQFADKCDWGQLDGYDWVSLLIDEPQFADKCDWGKLNGSNWVWLLLKQPQFADKCDWNKLDGSDWADLLSCQPQFADKCDLGKLDDENWSSLLLYLDESQIIDRCDWGKLEESDWAKLDGVVWTYLLRRQPQFADRCDWDKLCGYYWAVLLIAQPQFAEKCDWNKLDGEAWELLLENQPQFADKCDWAKLTSSDWAMLLSAQPQFAEKCDWSKFSTKEWEELLDCSPELAIYKSNVKE